MADFNGELTDLGVKVIQTIPGSPSKVGGEGTGRARVATLDTRVTYKGLKRGISFVPKKNVADHDSSYEFTVGGGSCLPCTNTSFIQDRKSLTVLLHTVGYVVSPVVLWQWSVC